MKKKLLSLTLATALCLSNSLVGMETYISSSFAKDPHPLHTIATDAENDCMWPIEVDGKTIMVQVKEVVSVLLGDGKDINELNKNNLTPLDVAEQQGNTKLVEMLKEKGALNTYISFKIPNVQKPLQKKTVFLQKQFDYFDQSTLYTCKEGQTKKEVDKLVVAEIELEQDNISYGKLAQLFECLENHSDYLENHEKIDYWEDELSFKDHIKLLQIADDQIADYFLLKNRRAICDSIEMHALKLNRIDCMKITEDDVEVLAKFPIKMLTFTGNRQPQKLPDNIGKLKYLKFLTLSEFGFTDLPESIGDLINLETLHLPFNKLQKLPDSFCNLKKLQVLSLGNNQLEQLPKYFGNLENLQRCYLNDNFLTNLPASIFNLQINPKFPIFLVRNCIPESEWRTIYQNFRGNCDLGRQYYSIEAAKASRLDHYD